LLQHGGLAALLEQFGSTLDWHCALSDAAALDPG
jgi:hypothetical protein